MTDRQPHTSTPGSARRMMDDLADRVWAFAALSAAVESGLLGAVDGEATTAVIAQRTRIFPAVVGGLLDVLDSLGLVRRSGEAFTVEAELADFLRQERDLLAAQLRSAHLQASALIEWAKQGRLGHVSWDHDDPELLRAQGVASAAAVDDMAAALHKLPGGAQRLDSARPALLEVGAGVGAITTAMCRALPQLQVVALEPAPAPHQEAVRAIAAAGLSDRVEVRAQRVEDLDDHARFDFALLPLVFLPTSVLYAALRTIWRALAPEGGC